jgi:polyhydroxyalkanoate synthesis repressor PhaR
LHFCDALRYDEFMESRRETPTAGTRVIKRYTNRKLYDTSARRYVTLDDVAALVSRGEDLEVQDQASGEDLTTLILAQVLLDGVRQRTARIPRQVLARLIRIAGAPRSDWEEWPGPREAAGRAGDEAEKIAGRFLAGGRPSLEDALALREEIGQLVHRLVDEAQSGLESRLRGLLAIGEGAAGRSLGILRSGLQVFDAGEKPETPPPKKSSFRKRSSRPRAAKK